MATVTPNFNWPVPTSTDLVKDGATAIEALGDSIDASLVDLKGGTTGQVLSKNSNTDMDFTWVTDAAGDITGVTAGTGISGGGTSGTVTVTNSMATAIDAKGDLVPGTGADTFARLAVGANGTVLTADSAEATGLKWATPSGGSNTYYAGKNKFINGDFGVWQRGTSFALTSATGSFAADRYATYSEFTGGSITVSRQTFTPATAPVAGYEGQYFLRWAQTSTTGGTNPTSGISQNIEDVRTFAGQTVTLSFWAKADASRTVTTGYEQYCGVGGSGYISGSVGSYSVTTSWTRFSTTFTVPSLSGKTLGANSRLQINMSFPLNTTATIDTWGWQLEAGSSATDFVTASGGSLQGELAMCQRYYYRSTGGSSTGNSMGYLGQALTTTIVDFMVVPQATMRVAPTAVDFANIGVYRYANATSYTGGTITIYLSSVTNVIVARYTHGSAIFSINDGVAMNSGSNAATFIGFSAEL